MTIGALVMTGLLLSWRCGCEETAFWETVVLEDAPYAGSRLPPMGGSVPLLAVASPLPSDACLVGQSRELTCEVMP